MTSGSAPVPHGGDGPQPPAGSRCPAGIRSGTDGQREGSGSARGCGLNCAAKLRQRPSTQPRFSGGRNTQNTPSFGIPHSRFGGSRCPSEPARSPPGLAVAALASRAALLRPWLFFIVIYKLSKYTWNHFLGERGLTQPLTESIPRRIRYRRKEEGARPRPHAQHCPPSPTEQMLSRQGTSRLGQISRLFLCFISHLCPGSFLDFFCCCYFA